MPLPQVQHPADRRVFSPSRFGFSETSYLPSPPAFCPAGDLQPTPFPVQARGGNCAEEVFTITPSPPVSALFRAVSQPTLVEVAHCVRGPRSRALCSRELIASVQRLTGTPVNSPTPSQPSHSAGIAPETNELGKGAPGEHTTL